MEIKAVKLYEGGFMSESFALGGEDKGQTLDDTKTYSSSLQNYLIDMGNEVILIDTGLPKETQDTLPKAGQKIYQGKRIRDYVSALENLGYSPDNVSKILLTHKHPDHSGELRSFPNAKIYLSMAEAEAMNLTGDNIIPVEYNDGPYYNFEKSKKIADGVYFLPAPGHTKGNSVVVVEKDGLFYMIHGDITYTDEALRANKLSMVFEDLDAAKQSLEKVRTFIQKNPTVYISTHTPEGIESLEQKKVMKL
ncbi:MBL fold metallo-hydrolase [Aminipila terrae]|uniref:MBL fold metallo-hydrolase n=1 Tax=Aminipila terrae TaxID=2697030 RepID=A0A6P1MIA1_9FIRM|nr:MBL fold metallo-hydrolase [Aminipila terrae]QHI72923.1 MBL fold metallo-hydrolase [Aminipila terrae]